MSVLTDENSCIDAQAHIGAILRELRIGAGQSLADVATSLRIPENYLAAIEGLDKSSLPSLGYVLGFVRSYALHVGIDAKDAVARYKTDIECPQNMGMHDRPHHVPKRKIRIPKGSFAVGLVLSCLLVVVSWYGWQSDANSAQAVSTPSVQTPQFWICAARANSK